MKSTNILLNLLLIFFSITTLDLKPAARSSEAETKEPIKLIDSDDITIAIINGKKEVAIELIQSNLFNLNFKNKNGKTALYEATYREHSDLVLLLLEYGADANITDHNSWTLLMHAAYNGKTKAAELLLKHGADVNIKDNKGWTPLIVATFRGEIEVAELLLKHGADVNIKDNKGWTPLMHAAKTKSAELLLKHGADINAQNNIGSTALALAADHGNIRIVNFLLKHGVNINTKNFRGLTALMYASYNGHTEIAKLLLEYEADVNITNNRNETALVLATQTGNAKIINFLKNQKALHKYGEEIFKAYEQNDILTCKKYLNELNQNVFADILFLILKNKENNSLLHEAVMKRDYEFIKYILNYNSKVVRDLLTMTNNNGMTPIDLAVTDEYLLNYFMDFAYPPIQKSSCIVS